jgi:broad specificity phosphatase PhoE
MLTGRTPGHALGQEGRNEAARLADRLADLPIAAIHTSPVQRARETAEIIAARLALPVVVEPGLAEIDFGAWQGATFSELHGRADWHGFNTGRALAAVPGGETMLAAQARALDTLLALTATHPDAELVLVSHGDMIKALLALALGMPLDLMRRLRIDPASRSILSINGAEALVEAVNLPP